MNKELIYIALYKFLKLPDLSSIYSVKKTKKYILTDLNYTVSKYNSGKEVKLESNSIVSKEYKPNFFNDMVVISCEILSDKIMKKEYDSYILGENKASDKIVLKIDEVISRYKESIPSNLENYINQSFIDIGSAYYFEIEKNNKLLAAYKKDINDNDYPHKIKYYFKYILEFYIPNYWGYLVLAITIMLFLSGVIYAAI